MVAVVLGLLTMVLGGWRALREHDLKKLLAYGTVSQLGFLAVLFGAGTGDTALAGVGMLPAHALFKASLFLIVGIVDHATGTRDLRELSGLRRSAPWLCAAAAAATASMAGIPPFLGFVGKEAAFESLLTGRLADTVTLAGVVAARSSPSDTARGSCGEPSATDPAWNRSPFTARTPRCSCRPRCSPGSGFSSRPSPAGTARRWRATPAPFPDRATAPTSRCGPGRPCRRCCRPPRWRRERSCSWPGGRCHVPGPPCT
ncbi:proton-conducting transporter membrane subunit [Streptosporangium lutulentum]